MNHVLYFELNEQERQEIDVITREMGEILSDYINNTREISMKQFEEWRARFNGIYSTARPRSLEYFSKHPPELIEGLKEETLSRVCFIAEIESSRDKNFAKDNIANYINSIAPYLEILKDKASKGYDEIIKFIDYNFHHRKKIYEKEKQSLSIRNNCNPMPTGAALSMYNEILTAGGREGIEKLPKRKKAINHSSKYSIRQGEPIKGEQLDSFVIQKDLSNRHGKIIMILPSEILDRLTGNSITVKKIFILLLQKINEQVYHEGTLTRNYIEFSPHELIDKGIYDTPQSAKKGFIKAMNILTGIKVCGELQFKKGKAIISPKLAVLFPTVETSRDSLKVYLNQQVDEINWQFFFQAFSMLPDYYYELSPRASELLCYIFSIARQHTQDIKERGHFSISMRAIQQVMHLPDEDETEHPKRDIKDEIEKAVYEIENIHRKHFNGDEDLFFLSLEYQDKWDIKRFLNEGSLYVSLAGDFAEPFIAVEDDKRKGLREAKRRQQKALQAKNETKGSLPLPNWK